MESFNRSSNGAQGRQQRCKSCMAIVYKTMRANNLDRYTANSNKWKQSAKERYILWKSQQKCILCGEDEPSALDCHHLDPTEKEFSISSASMIKKWAVLEKELEKCVILCSNCHRKVHAKLITLL